MRTLDERKAEVYRRSEIILVKRRKRLFYLVKALSCIFVCTVISFAVGYYALIKPNLHGEDTDKPQVPSEEHNLGDHIDNSGAGTGNTANGNGPNSGNHIDSNGTGNTVSGDEPNGWTSVGSNQTYTIQITDAKGNMIVYDIIDNTLYDLTHGTTRKLTDEQLEDIKQLFNLNDE